MKRIIAMIFCALSILALTSCKSVSSTDDSSSTTPATQPGTGKKSSFVIEEVTD
ncbi:MAG: hypothetical protein IKO47_12065 [Ruminococcus sp.]|nr:hypothetical protein [Ruminococcus sp.]